MELSGRVVTADILGPEYLRMRQVAMAVSVETTSPEVTLSMAAEEAEPLLRQLVAMAARQLSAEAAGAAVEL
jgi:hypothetical protein